ENADRHVALRISSLLGGCGYRVEPDVREEDHACAADHAAPPINARLTRRIGWNERVPVRRIHEREPDADHEKDDRNLHEDDEVVESRRLFDADTRSTVIAAASTS